MITIPDEAPYRHERLALGSLQVPGTVHMHFEAAGHREAQQTLIEQLVQFGGTPKESFEKIIRDCHNRKMKELSEFSNE